MGTAGATAVAGGLLGTANAQPTSGAEGHSLHGKGPAPRGKGHGKGHHRGKRPNVLVILADDMGWSDIGPFGAVEIRTPHLDALAARGVRMTNFHVSPYCAPTRAMLLTGADNHEVGLGNMIELIQAEQRGGPATRGTSTGEP